MIQGNEISSNRIAGIAFREWASGVASGNDIGNNGGHGISVLAAGARPRLTDNHIHGNGGAGILVKNRSEPTLCGNEVDHNATGISVGGQARPKIKHNRAHHNRGPGILFEEKSAGDAAKNELFENEGVGIEVRDPDTGPLIRANEIHDNSAGGLMFRGGAAGVARNNKLSNDPSESVAVQGAGTRPLLQGNMLFRRGAFQTALADARNLLRQADPDWESAWEFAAHAATLPAVHLTPTDLWWRAGVEAQLDRRPSASGTSSRPLDDILRVERALDRGNRPEVLAPPEPPLPEPVQQRLNLARFQALRAAPKPEEGDLAESLKIFPGGPAEAWRTAVASWPGRGPLPHYLRSEIRRFSASDDLNGLLDRLGTSRLSGAKLRRLVNAALEVFFDPKVGEAVPPRSRREADAACGICFEALTDQTSFTLARCQCESTFCRDCVRAHMEQGDSSGYQDCCPGVGCGARAARQDLEVLGLDKKAIDARMFRQIAARLHERPGFVHCTGADCLGGCQTAPGAKPDMFTCGLCATTTVPGQGSVDTLIVRKLLEGLFASDSPRGNGTTRPCYECGLTTEKGAACAHMQCRGCKGDWDYVFGKHREAVRYDDAGIGPQRYRPKADGVLEQLGFWPDSIPPGALLTDAQVDEVQSRAKEWIAKLPPPPAEPAAQPVPEAGARA